MRMVLSLFRAAVAASALLCHTAGYAQAASAPAGAASAPALKPELAKPLQAAQAALAARNWTEAMDRVAEAEKLPEPPPYAQYLFHRFRAQAAIGLNNLPLAAESLEKVLNSPFLVGAEVPGMQAVLARIRINQKDFPRAVVAIKRYIELGGPDADLRRMLGHAQLLAGDPAAAGATLAAEVEADRKSGVAPREQALKLMAQAANDRKDMAAYVVALELLAEFHPKPEYWDELVNRVMRTQGFAERLMIDGLRFARAAGVLKSADDHTDLAQLALTAGIPSEAQKVMTEGYAAGLLGKGNDADKQAKLRDQVAKAAAADKGAMADPDAAARSIRDGDAVVNLGVAVAMDGQPERGLAVAEQGMARPALRRPDEARLHLAMLQWMAGKTEAAQQSLAAVKGSDGTAALARLWSIFLRSPASQRKPA